MTNGITQDKEGRYYKTGSSAQPGLGKISRTDRIRQDQQARKD
jgi:hypothetical protein